MPDATETLVKRVTPENDSLDQLTERLRRSDRRAYAELFQRLHEPLLRYVHRITRDESLALDVVQDVFLKLWVNRTTLEIKVSCAALLYTMARNRALNENRNRARRAGPSDQLTSDKTPIKEPGVDERLAADELNRCFRDWVQKMPPRRAEAFVLSRYHQLSHKEIGAIMGLSKRTIDTHIVHALRFLRSQYEALSNKGIKP